MIIPLVLKSTFGLLFIIETGKNTLLDLAIFQSSNKYNGNQNYERACAHYTQKTNEISIQPKWKNITVIKNCYRQDHAVSRQIQKDKTTLTT